MQRIVDDFLAGNFTAGMSATDLWDIYAMFGEDPFVVTGPGRGFSGWSYAKQRCAQICKPTT